MRLDPAALARRHIVRRTTSEMSVLQQPDLQLAVGALLLRALLFEQLTHV